MSLTDDDGDDMMSEAQDPETQISSHVTFDIETIGGTMFSIGAAVTVLLHNAVDDSYPVKTTAKKRFSTHRLFPNPSGSSYPFWRQFRHLFDQLNKEAVPAQEMAMQFHEWLVKIGAKTDRNTRYMSDFGGFDLGGISEFLRGRVDRQGRPIPTMEFFRGPTGVSFRGQRDTHSMAIGILARSDPTAFWDQRDGWNRLYDALGMTPADTANPFEHTHLPDDDAAHDGVRHMNIVKFLHKNKGG